MVTPGSQNRRLLDRYDLRDPLGRGGMGVVWLAHDTVLQRPVAVKEVELPPGIPDDEAEALRARVMREARSAGRLNHPNVTTIYDVVRDDGRTWIVMEYVDAPTLTDLVHRHGPVAPTEAARIGLQVLAALEAAHAAGIVHRDVKPGNVMVSETGTVKLADFGVAAVQGDPKITMTGLIIGSPSYMAPEQAREGHSTAASDLWGLGATLYFAVEGEPPFDKGAAIPTLTAVAHGEPRIMQRAGELEPVILRLLSKDPADRPTAGELKTVLGDVAATSSDTTTAAATAIAPTRPLEPVTPQPVPPAPAPDDAAAHDEPPARDSRPHRGRSPLPVILGVVALLVLAGWLLSTLLRGGADDGAEDIAQQRDTAEEPGAQEPDEDAAGADAGTAEAPADSGDEAADDDAATQPAAPQENLPEDWERYQIGDTGSTVAYPGDWDIEQRSATSTDLVDPAGGRYLRVDYTDTPKDDPVADWEAQSEAFGARKDDYREVAITEVDFRGHPAALWEYTYSEGGAQLHAYNLAIVAGDRGYALNFQTHESQWADSQPLWEQLRDSFQASE